VHKRRPVPVAAGTSAIWRKIGAILPEDRCLAEEKCSNMNTKLPSGTELPRKTGRPPAQARPDPARDVWPGFSPVVSGSAGDPAHARQPTVWSVPPPDVDPRDARLELARRYPVPSCWPARSPGRGVARERCSPCSPGGGCRRPSKTPSPPRPSPCHRPVSTAGSPSAGPTETGSGPHDPTINAPRVFGAATAECRFPYLQSEI
jgi:hypothetical protein